MLFIHALVYLFMDWFFCYFYLLILFIFFLFHVRGYRCWWPTCSSVSRHPWVWVWAWGSQRCRPPSPPLLSQEHSKALPVEPSSMLPSLRQVPSLPLPCMCLFKTLILQHFRVYTSMFNKALGEVTGVSMSSLTCWAPPIIHYAVTPNLHFFFFSGNLLESRL